MGCREELLSLRRGKKGTATGKLKGVRFDQYELRKYRDADGKNGGTRQGNMHGGEPCITYLVTDYSLGFSMTCS